MKLDDVISNYDKEILRKERDIVDLQKEKAKYQKIKELYPAAHYTGRAICLPNIWDKITCMRIERKRKYYSMSYINVKFFLGKGQLVEGMKIYTLPFDNPVAAIKHTYGMTKEKQIEIFDYKKIIPDECPRKKAFIKRIKLYLVRSITQDGLTIDNKSFDKDEITKLMLLR